AGNIIIQRTIPVYPDTGTFESAQAAAQRLAPKLSVGDAVCAEQPADGPVAYYLWRAQKPQDYLARPLSTRKYWIHIGPAIPGNDWNPQGADVLFSSSAFTVYDGTDAATTPQSIAGGTCWSPAAEAGL
ncbi:MAG TPA: hypothetical protein VG672_02150, partial [Bryobacteraceae bacterium]|nr:hypothetical protein [Bryobacteraceae bacterium]